MDQPGVIKRDEWQMYADMIRSEQIPSDHLVFLFEENPEFSEWYFKCFYPDIDRLT